MVGHRRQPAAAGRWTWLVIAAHTQLRPARPLAEDLRNPWERPTRHGRLTPARVRRGFRCLHGKTPQPANAPNPTTAVPGRPIGTKNKNRAREHHVGKQDKPNLAGAVAGSRAAKNANAEETASFATEFAVASVVIADSVEPARICVCPLLALAKARPIGT
ncbi:hypothetical protein SMICM17S_04716 [Streptomyces microflavus]